MMRIYVVDFEDGIDLRTLQKVTATISNPRNKYVSSRLSYYYYPSYGKKKFSDGVHITAYESTHCRESLTSFVRSAFTSKDTKNKVVLVYVSAEAKGIPIDVFKRDFQDFAVEFLSHSRIPEDIVRAGTYVPDDSLTFIFPITVADAITDFISASALILLFRRGQKMLRGSKEFLSYGELLSKIVPSSHNRSASLYSWGPGRTTTIGSSTFMWYLLHFFDLHNLKGLHVHGHDYCNGPQSFYGHRSYLINQELSSFNDLTRISMIKELFGRKKDSFVKNFSEDFRKTFNDMLDKCSATKVKKIKGASL